MKERGIKWKEMNRSTIPIVNGKRKQMRSVETLIDVVVVLFTHTKFVAFFSTY